MLDTFFPLSTTRSITIMSAFGLLHFLKNCLLKFRIEIAQSLVQSTAREIVLIHLRHAKQTLFFIVFKCISMIENRFRFYNRFRVVNTFQERRGANEFSPGCGSKLSTIFYKPRLFSFVYFNYDLRPSVNSRPILWTALLLFRSLGPIVLFIFTFFPLESTPFSVPFPRYFPAAIHKNVVAVFVSRKYPLFSGTISFLLSSNCLSRDALNFTPSRTNVLRSLIPSPLFI